MSKTNSCSLPSLPSDWKFLPFRNICRRLIHGGTPSTSIAAYWKGNTPWITGADFENNNINIIRRHITDRAIKESSTNIVPKGRILLVSRTGVGKIAIAEFDVAISQDITGIDLDNSEALDKYIYYALQNELEELKKYNQGTSINGILREDLLKHHFPIPDLCEQQTIADILTTLDNLIDHTESLIAKYQSIKQGMMHDLFTRGVDANGRLRTPREEAPELYKESALGWIPKEWEVVQLSAAISSIDAGKSFESPDIPAAPGEWGVLKVSAVHPDGFRSIENKVITKKIYINSKYQVLDGDLLITRANTPDLVGLSCIVENPKGRLLLCDKTLRLEIKNNFNKKYIFYALQTDIMRRQIQISGTGSSGSMKNITQSDIFSFILLTPELKEQQHIQKALHPIDALIHSEKTHLHKINCLKLGLMHDLLTGTVRIPPHLATAQEPPHAL